MSSPAPKYGPSMAPKLNPSRNYLIDLDFKKSIEHGIVMTTGILVSTFVIKKVKKDMAPDLRMKNAIPLAIVTILSDYLIKYGKEYKYIPLTI